MLSVAKAGALPFSSTDSTAACREYTGDSHFDRLTDNKNTQGVKMASDDLAGCLFQFVFDAEYQVRTVFVLKGDLSNVVFELRFERTDGSINTVHSAQVSGSYWVDLGQAYPVQTMYFVWIDSSLSGPEFELFEIQAFEDDIINFSTTMSISSFSGNFMD